MMFDRACSTNSSRRTLFADAILCWQSRCPGDMNVPTAPRKTITFAPIHTMKFNVAEQTLFGELTKGMSTEKATRMLERLQDRSVTVFGSSVREQELIRAIYQSMDARERQALGGRPRGLPPRTEKNSWIPNTDDWVLINDLLNRLPTQGRDRIKDEILRTDSRLNKRQDPEIQRLLDAIYERRALRMREAEGPGWK